jgi:protein-S-isoprenylcysteine O-methyltransferase
VSDVERTVYRSTPVGAVFIVSLVVFTVLSMFLTLGSLLTVICRIPFSSSLPLSVRWFGLLLIGSGLVFFRWLFRYRKPIDVVLSTYTTVLKAIRRERLEERTGRTEPLIIEGPYKYVRHPLYLGEVLLVLGWWLLLDYSFLFISAVLLLLWFNFVVATFEEKELIAIFGEEYAQYSRNVPKLIPFIKRRTERKTEEA